MEDLELVVNAVDRMYESAKAAVDMAQQQLDEATSALVVASRIQDLVHAQRDKTLRVVS